MSRKGSSSSTSSSSSSSVVDPLSSVLDGTDPLSMFAASADPAATVTRPLLPPSVVGSAGAAASHLFCFQSAGVPQGAGGRFVCSSSADRAAHRVWLLEAARPEERLEPILEASSFLYGGTSKLICGFNFTFIIPLFIYLFLVM